MEKIYEKSVKKADYIVNYSNLKTNCFHELKSLVIFLDLNIDEELINKSFFFFFFQYKKNVKDHSQKIWKCT